MKGLFSTSCILFLTSLLYSQTIKLDYEPKGAIVKFNFNSSVIFTDTTALFEMYINKNQISTYNLSVLNLVRKEFSKTQNDTVTFSGNLIPFNHGTENKYQGGWDIKWVIWNLTKKNGLKIVNRHGQNVKKIRRKEIRKRWFIKRILIDKDTKEELFREVIHLLPGAPDF